MVELVDTLDLGSSAERRESSSLSERTIFTEHMLGRYRYNGRYSLVGEEQRVDGSPERMDVGSTPATDPRLHVGAERPHETKLGSYEPGSCVTHPVAQLMISFLVWQPDTRVRQKG